MIRPITAAIALALACSAVQASETLSAEQLRIGPGQALDSLAEGIAGFAKRAGEPLVPVLVELDATPAFSALPGVKLLAGEAKRQRALQHHRTLAQEQDGFLASLGRRGFPILLRSKSVSTEGVPHRIEYRFSHLFNGFVAFVPESRVAELRAEAGVRAVTPIAPTRLMLNHSVDYLLGSQPTRALRREAVYGMTEELGPSGDNGNGPALVPVDGFEGQGIVLGVIDSGMDYEHPMLGGSGSSTPQPQRPPLFSTGANAKVLYWYNLGGATTLDDHGHGTHVSSTAGGYLVDGDTPLVTPTLGAPFGPTPGGVAMHGVAPQVQLMGWPVCAATGNCPGDIELAIEDAISPVVLTGTGDGGSLPLATPKPIADVINLSLGGGTDPASSSARVSNSAVLAGGVVVVAAAGNDGPGASSVGAPCVGGLVMCVASVLDPGSTSGSDVLAAGETSPDACADTASSCLAAPPSAETGAASEANLIAPGERAGIKSFGVAGGGELPGGSVSAHYVLVDRNQVSIPSQVTGRIAILEGGTGTFAQIINPVAALNPRAILLVSATTNATAVAVLNGVPTFTISPADGAYLKDLMLSEGSPGHGSVSRLPLRVRDSVALEAFTGEVSSFSSRGPNAHANGRYRTIKPDVAGLGQAILAATTPTGNVDAGIGMANPSGYTSTSGTSMASPHVAGAAALVRQRVRALGYDSIDLDDPDYRSKRFRAQTLVRALLTNTATSLRTGLGEPDPDAPDLSYTIHDVGAGLVDVDAALRAHAIMTSPTVLFDLLPNEFTPPPGELPVPVDADGNAIVPLPTASFGEVEAIGAEREILRERVVTIEDIDGQGSGIWTLSFQNDVLADHAAVSIRFLPLVGEGEISQVTVPPNGAVSFRVQVGIQGNGGLPANSLVTWFVSADHGASGQRLRMPFLLRTLAFPVPALGQPEDPWIVDAEAPNAAGCPVAPANAFGLEWAYTPSGGGTLDPSGYRLQRGRFETELFFDDASEPLMTGANSLWTGSAQWSSTLNPDTGNPAYFVPNLVEQSESLDLISAIPLPASASGASLSITTRIATEPGFDFANVLVNGSGGAYQPIDRRSGDFSGTLNYDVSAFTGQDLGIRLTLSSDLLVTGEGWYVDEVRVSSNDFADIGDVDASPTLVALQAPAAGTWRYRLAGLYDVDGTPVRGAYTASACVCVPSTAFEGYDPDAVFRSGFEPDDPPAPVHETCE
jgi:subtilisin family serine protease